MRSRPANAALCAARAPTISQVASFLGANVLMLLAPTTRTISVRQFTDHKLSLIVLSLVFVRRF